MNKKQLIAAWVILLLMMLVNSGCAVLKTTINTALNAAIVYGIYQATK